MVYRDLTSFGESRRLLEPAVGSEAKPERVHLIKV